MTKTILKNPMDVDEMKQQIEWFTNELIKDGVQSYSITFYNGFKVIFMDKKSSEYRTKQKTKEADRQT